MKEVVYEEYNNDKVVEFVKKKTNMNNGMLKVATFMTDGSWENADYDTKIQKLKLFMTYKAKKLGGLNFNSLLPDLQHEFVEKTLGNIAANIKDGKDALILLTDQEMSEIAFPSFSTDIGGTYEDPWTATLARKAFDEQKKMISSVAAGNSAANVLGKHVQEQEIEDIRQSDMDKKEMDRGGEGGLQDFLYYDDTDPDALYGENRISAMQALYGSEIDEEGLNDEGQEFDNEQGEINNRFSMDSINDDIEPANMVNLNDLMTDIDEVKKEEEKKKEEIKKDKKKAYTDLKPEKVAEYDYSHNDQPAGAKEEEKKKKKRYDDLQPEKTAKYDYSANDYLAKEQQELQQEKKQEEKVIEDPFFDVDKLGRNPLRSTLEDICKKKLKDNEKNPVTSNENNVYDMANLVIAKSLLSRGATKEGGAFGPGTFTLTEAANEKIDRMRKMILKDPVFQGLCNEGVRSDKIVDKYLKEKAKDVSERTKIRLEMYEDGTYQETREKHQDQIVTLTDEQKKYLKDLHSQLFAFNKGERREGYNGQMMECLRNVNEKAKLGTLTYDNLDALRYFSALYYRNREGILFSPRTKAGQDRLETAGKIFDVTQDIIKEYLRDYDSPEKRTQRFLKAQLEKIEKKNNKFIDELDKIDFAAKLKDPNFDQNMSVEDQNKYIIKQAAGLYIRENLNKFSKELDSNNLPIVLREKYLEMVEDPAFAKALGIENMSEPVNAAKIADRVLQKDKEGKSLFGSDYDRLHTLEMIKPENMEKNVKKKMEAKAKLEAAQRSFGK